MPVAGAVLVSGATGQIGLFAARLLLDAGCEVIGLSRRARAGEGQRAEQLRWLHPEMVPQLARGPAEASGRLTPGESPLGAVRVLISAGPIGLALPLLSACPKLTRVVCFSTSSVLVKRDSADESERRQMQAIRAEEERLGAECARRSVTLVVLRPTLVYGCGLDRNLSRMARWIARWNFMPVAGEASGLRQPVHAADLGEIAVRAAGEGVGEGFSGVVTGGSSLRYRRMVEAIFTALGRQPHILSLPPALLERMARWRLPGLSGINPEMVRRQNTDLVFDGTPAAERFGLHPRPFAPLAADFELPGELRSLLP